MNDDRAERAQSLATDGVDPDVADGGMERVSEPEMPPTIYSIQTRAYSGDWKTVAETCDPNWALQAVALLRWSGADVRTETIPTPLIL
jgi:hypothetical protein